MVQQYNEYKLRDKGAQLAIGLMFLTDIHSI
jgi:branched-chain amino acid transport system substrate-binding protein